ncbi:MAG: aromatic-ring-hydroxylating dioxygenase subunit beta [Novosphingobium sp.]
MTDHEAARAFVELEADLLDHRDYTGWLELWDEAGVYVVPVDADGDTDDFADHLNIAFDDAEMRRMRINRLTSGDAISTQLGAMTVRSVSRLRVLCDDGVHADLRCAQFIAENNHGTIRIYPADVTFRLRREGGTFRILRKIVRLLHAEHAMAAIGYIL